MAWKKLKMGWVFCRLGEYNDRHGSSDVMTEWTLVISSRAPQQTRTEIYIYSCCAYPNASSEQFELLLNQLLQDVVEIKSVLIAGDLNSYVVKWGSQKNKQRGRKLLEIFADQAGLYLHLQKRKYRFYLRSDV